MFQEKTECQGVVKVLDRSNSLELLSI